MPGSLMAEQQSQGRKTVRNTSREQLVNGGSNLVASGVFADPERLKVRLAACDLAGFRAAKIVQECASFRLHDEVKPFALIRVDQHGPIGVVAPEGRRHREPARQFGVELDG